MGTTQRLVDEINSKLTTWQDDNQVAAVNQIQTSLNPARIQEFHLTGSRVRAGLATIGLGLALTVAAMIVLPRRLARWQPSWRPRGAPSRSCAQLLNEGLTLGRGAVYSLAAALLRGRKPYDGVVRFVRRACARRRYAAI